MWLVKGLLAESRVDDGLAESRVDDGVDPRLSAVRWDAFLCMRGGLQPTCE